MRLKRLIREKPFLGCIGISLILWVVMLIIAFIEPPLVYDAVWWVSLFSMVGYGATVGRFMKFMGMGYYPQLVSMYLFIILFWALVIYTILLLLRGLQNLGEVTLEQESLKVKSEKASNIWQLIYLGATLGAIYILITFGGIPVWKLQGMVMSFIVGFIVTFIISFIKTGDIKKSIGVGILIGSLLYYWTGGVRINYPYT